MIAQADPTLLALLTPLVAVVLALLTRRICLSLLAGILLGQLLLADWSPLGGIRGTLLVLGRVLVDPGQALVVLFVALVGAVLLLADRTGGVAGFVAAMERRGWGRSRRSAQLVTMLVGALVFIETSISCLVAGAIGRPLCDRARVSREKLAYLCDSMAAPLGSLFLLVNAWGVCLLGILEPVEGLEGRSTTAILLGSMKYNFYALASIGLALVLVLLDRDFFAMGRAQRRAREEGRVLREGARPLLGSRIIAAGPLPGVVPRARHFLVPILVMLVLVPVGLYITGACRIGWVGSPFAVMAAGSGTKAVLMAVVAALSTAVCMALAGRLMPLGRALGLVVDGAAGMLPMALLMVLAFGIGRTCKELDSGRYVAVLLAGLDPVWLAPLLFPGSCLIAFATGTSFGAMGIMVPVGLPAALALGADPALAVAAILSGAVFGDHCSPISDTTLIASMASASDHVDHVRTQLPYALVAALIALVAFCLAGI